MGVSKILGEFCLGDLRFFGKLLCKTFENIKDAYKKIKSAKKHPTSINLSPETVADLKRLAAKKGIPYQSLMRMLVLEGVEKLKKSA